MDEIQELYNEESLHELKELRKDINNGALDRLAIGKILRNVHQLKGDAGNDGVGIKSITSEHVDDDIVVRILKTDETIDELTFKNVKGKDGDPGKDGKDALPGKDGEAATIEIGSVSTGDKAVVKNVGNKYHAKLELVLPKALKGEAGTDGQDGEGINWRGQWNVNTVYQVNDAVAYVGSSYICVKAGKSVPTSANWNLLAQKGTDAIGGGSGKGRVVSVVGGTNVTVDDSDPANPIISASGSGSGDMLAATYDPAGKDAQLAADSEVVHKTGSETVSGAKTFTASGSDTTGAIITNDITVKPNSGVSTSASMFLDNEAGQVWEFGNDSNGNWLVYDKTAGQQIFYADAGSTPNSVHITDGTVYLGSPLNMQSKEIYGTSAITFNGSSSSYMQLQGPATGDGGTIILPATADTLVGKATTDVLTYKDLTSDTNTFPTRNFEIAFPIQETTGPQTYTTYTNSYLPGIIDKSKFSNITSIVFRVYMTQNNSGTFAGYCQLFDMTGNAVVTGSELTASLSQYANTILETDDLSSVIANSSNAYSVQYKVASGGSVTICSAALVVRCA